MAYLSGGKLIKQNIGRRQDRDAVCKDQGHSSLRRNARRTYSHRRHHVRNG